MPRISKASFACVTTQGGLFPAEFLARVAAGDGKGAPEGLEPADYHLPGSERLPEAVNRSWNVVKGRWEDFRKRAGQLAPGDHATGLTREHWLLPLFQELGFGRLQAPPQKIEIDDREYPVSHMWGGVPIHLLGIGLEIDRRTPGAAGAARMSPHAMLQEYLNRSETALWGIVTNGRTLRLLRDNAALTRQAYVEFDLQAIFDGNHFSDFALLWLLCHQSRFEGGRPELSWLEKWTQEARKQGVRLLEHLRDGVEKSIEALGTGFLAHPANQPLRDRLHAGTLATQDYYRQVLRLVYRLIFLFVAEDRDLLLLPSAPAAARDRYRRFYSTRRLRDLALRRAGTAHGDLWEMLALVMRALGSDDGCPALALPALGSFLWSDAATPDLSGMKLANRHLLDALRCLAAMRSQEEKVRRVVDYRNLGAEELGSVYESLLELHPQINLSARTFALSMTAGNERKTSGSYYTPDSLVQCLLDSALDPVMDEAVKGRKGAAAADAILTLKVCDPAVGSGHFLIAAAHRMARRVAAARSGEDEPAPDAIHTALRQVIGRCLYGVDINPMSAELCKVSLWMEAMEPGKPLSFLDHHIQCGNSLLGATPGLMARGIPDEAFEPIEGDDRKVCSGLKKRNRQERGGQLDMLHLMAGTAPAPAAALTGEFQDLETLGDASLGEVRQKQDRYSSLVDSPTYRNARLSADAWCAAFVWRKDGTDPAPITADVFKRLQADPSQVAKGQRDEIDRLAAQYRFFHWHLAFPEVFQSLETIGEKDSKGWKGGFDVVLGNPPWERVKLEEKQWFEAKSPSIAQAQTAAIRKQMIRDLVSSNLALLQEFKSALRTAEAESRFLRDSNRFARSGVGDVNTFAVFTELATDVVHDRGMAGTIIPTGLLTDDQLKGFSSHLVETGRLVSAFGFENEEFLFEGIANVVRFCAITISGPARPTSSARVAFYMRRAEDLKQEERFFALTPADVAKLNPKTRTCPIFRTRHDAALTLRLYERFPLLGPAEPRSDGWDIKYLSMFHMANDSGLFLSAPSGDALPLYEAKLFWHYDHRFGSYELKGKLKGKGGRGLPDMPLEFHKDPCYTITPQFWVGKSLVRERVPEPWRHEWLIAYRDVSSAKLERTVVGAVIPKAAVGHTSPLILLGSGKWKHAHRFLSCFNSLVFDYIARQKIGGTHVSFYQLDQVPMPEASAIGEQDDAFLRCRVLELVYTAWDLQPFAYDLGCEGPPLRWDIDRRFQIQCEIDAFYALHYGLSREELLFVLDPHEVYGPTYPGESFRVLKEKEVARYGSFRTRDTVLKIYDEMCQARANDQTYQAPLDPPPAASACCHVKIKVAILAYGSLINDPGTDLAPLIKFRLKTKTPFRVEYGRLSKGRGGAPTLVPDERGAPVDAEILVLSDGVTFEKARDLLWCRERHKVGTGETYREGAGEDCVLSSEWKGHSCVERLLYTDFNPSGKAAPSDPQALAAAAIDSVKKAEEGKDGITYLMNAIAAGICTPLTETYRAAILQATNASSLEDALQTARSTRSW